VTDHTETGSQRRKRGYVGGTEIRRRRECQEEIREWGGGKKKSIYGEGESCRKEKKFGTKEKGGRWGKFRGRHKGNGVGFGCRCRNGTVTYSAGKAGPLYG